MIKPQYGENALGLPAWSYKKKAEDLRGVIKPAREQALLARGTDVARWGVRLVLL